MRHNAVVPFIGTDAMALGFLAREGLVTSEAFTRFLVLIPPLRAGQWLGARSFRTADPAAFRRRVLALLAVLALPTGLQGLLMLTA